MAEELINQIISNDAFAQVEKLQKQLQDTVTIFSDVSANAKAFDAVLRGAKGLAELQKAIQDGANAQQKMVDAGNKVIEVTEQIRKEQMSAADSLNAFKKQVNDLTKEYNSLGSSEDSDLQRKKAIRNEVLALTAAFSGQKTALDQAKKGIDAAEKSYYELQNQTTALMKQLKGMPGAFDDATGAINKNNKEAALMADQIRKNNDLLKQYDAQLGQSFRNVGNYGGAINGLKDYLTFTTGYFGAAFVAAAATRAIVNSNVEISDSITEVQRVAGMTTPEINSLYAALKQIDTRTSLDGLLNLARVGAQIGVANKDLVGFTTALNELNVALGAELKGGPEGIATSLSKVINLMDLNNEFGVQKALEKTGSAILVLGQKTIATGDYLTDFAERVGGIAKVAHISLPNMLAYGAALEANGVTAELAGTNFQRLITQLGRVPEKFYNIAKSADPGLTLQQFINYINTDANKALQLFFEGLNKSSSTFTAFAQATKSIGLPGQRTAQVLSALATSIGEIGDYTKIANDAFNEGTAVIDQYKLKNDNLAGSVAQLHNELTKLTTDPQSNLGKFFMVIVDGATASIRSLNEMAGEVGKLFDQIFRPQVFQANIKASANASEQQRLFGFNKTFADQFATKTKDEQKKILEDQQALLKQSIQEYNAALSNPATYNAANMTTDVTGKNTYNKILTPLTEQLEKDKDLVERLQQIYNALPKNKPAANAPGTTPTDDKAAKEAARKRLAELKTENSEQISLDKQMRDLKLANAKKEGDALRQMDAERLQNDISTEQNIMNDNTKSLDERLAAFKKYVDDEKQLLETEKDNAIQALESSAFSDALKRKQNQALLDARKKKGGPLTDTQAQAVLGNVALTDSEKQQVIDSMTNQEQLIVTKYRDKLAQWLKTLPKMGNQVLNGGLDTGVQSKNDQVQFEADSQLTAMNDSYAHRLISQKQYDDAKKEIEFETNAQILQNQIAGINSFLDSAELGDERIAESRRKLAELEMQLSDLTTQHSIDNEQKKADKIAEVLGYIQQFGDQFIGTLGSAAQNQATTQKNALQNQVDAINKTKDAEISAVNESLLSQQDKANKVAIINATAQAQTDALQRKQKQADEQQAKFQKAQAIFDIILNTAVAVTKYVSMGNIPLAVIAGAMGAAELAVASAQPIPKYAKGRKGGKAEMAIVGEQGAELIQMPGGKQVLTPGKPTLTFLPEDAIVKPHNETIIELARQNVLRSMLNMPSIDERNMTGEYMQSMEKEMRELRNAIRNIPIQHTNFEWSERGVSKWIEKNGSVTRWINNIKR